MQLNLSSMSAVSDSINNKVEKVESVACTGAACGELFFICTNRITHVKVSQLVASLQTSRQQVVFARLVTSCQQV